jgi:flagellar basal body rod protein FlgG
VIDPSIAAAFGRIEKRAEDVHHAYDSAYRPSDTELRRSGGAKTVPDASPLSVAAPPGTFFVLQGHDGTSLYTQDGAFSFEKGTLRTSTGDIVLGFRSDRAAQLAPLAASPVDIALQRVDGAQIDPDGSLSCSLHSIEPKTGERILRRVLLGHLALVRFPMASEPISVDGTRVRAPDGISPHAGIPGGPSFPALKTHVRQLANLDIETGLGRLQEAYTSLEVLQAANKARGEAEKSATDLLK